MKKLAISLVILMLLAICISCAPSNTVKVTLVFPSTISTVTVGGETVASDASVNVEKGKEIEIVATPASGKTFTAWYTSTTFIDTLTDLTSDQQLSTSATYKATFDADVYLYAMAE